MRSKKMTELKLLTPEITEALGKNHKFIERYQQLLEKSRHESIKDNVDAIRYIDDVVKRCQAIEATCPIEEKLIAKKNTYLPRLQRHIAELCMVSFSKPGDAETRLKTINIPTDTIEKIVKNIEQPGDPIVTPLVLATAAIVSVPIWCWACSKICHR